MTQLAPMAIQVQIDLDIQRSTKVETVPSDEQFRLWARSALCGREDTISLAIRIVDELEAQDDGSWLCGRVEAAED